MKKCFECENSKELEAFSQDKSRKDGLQHVCKACRKFYYINNRTKIRIQKKEYNSQPKIKKKRNRILKAKRRTDPNFKIKHNLRIRMRDALKKNLKSARTIELHG